MEARVYLKPGVTENIKLKGRIEAEGEITNQAHAGGGEGEGFDKPGSATLYAIGASIEKKGLFLSEHRKRAVLQSRTAGAILSIRALRSGPETWYVMR